MLIEQYLFATFFNYYGSILEDLYYESSEWYQLGPSDSVWIKFISFSRTFSWNKGSRPFFGRKVFLLDANTRQISGINKWRFLLQCLDDLDQGLRRLQSRLYVVRGQPLDALPNLIKRWKITYLSFEEDPEPFGRVRDENIKAMCKEMGVKTVTEKSHTLYDLDRFVF